METKYKIALIVGIVLVVSALLYFTAAKLWGFWPFTTGTLDSSDSSTTTSDSKKKIVIKSNNLINANRLFHKTPVEETTNCSVATAEELMITNGVNMQIYSCVTPLTDLDSRDWFYQTMYTDGIPKHYYLTRDTSRDLVVNIDNVTGKVYCVYLNFQADNMSKGFDPGNEVSSFEPSTLVVTTSSKTVFLTKEKPLDTTGTDVDPYPYEFDCVNAKSIAMDISGISNIVYPLPTGVTDRGVFRICSEYMDFHYKISGTSYVFRVILSAPSSRGRMGDKLIKDPADGKFKFVDMGVSSGTFNVANAKLVTYTEYKDSYAGQAKVSQILSFWSSPRDNDGTGTLTIMDEKEGGGSMDSSTYRTLFNNNRIGIPLEMVETTAINWGALTADSTVTLDFQVNGSANFPGYAGKEATLTSNIILQAVIFEIDGLVVKSKITIA